MRGEEGERLRKGKKKKLGVGKKKVKSDRREGGREKGLQ